MSDPQDTLRHERVYRLTLELQTLRGRLNSTIDQLCELVAGFDASGTPVGLSPLAGEGLGQSERTLVPAWLRVPSADATVANPESGHRLAPDSTVYSDSRNGFVQLIQIGQPRGADEHYSMVVNYADFDGSYLSIVLDGRPLLAQMPTGPARLSLAVEVRGTPPPTMHAKCSWRFGEYTSERALRVQAGQLAADSCAIDFLDPSQISTFDIHLIFNPVARGSFEIRRFSAGLIVTPPAEAPQVSSVFETAP